jgi:ssRNA-specific RNase YbeY (16S rRNA maturation enzyme)
MQIKIGPISYDVVEVSELASDAGMLHGDINFSKCRIRLDADDNAQRQHQTLWHEVLHGILHGAGIRDGHSEQQIEALAHGIIQVLQDNPLLVASQAGADKEKP